MNLNEFKLVKNKQRPDFCYAYEKKTDSRKYSIFTMDGGKTWEEINGQHGDYHDLWINPRNSKNMIIADDGGAVSGWHAAHGAGHFG